MKRTFFRPALAVSVWLSLSLLLGACVAPGPVVQSGSTSQPAGSGPAHDEEGLLLAEAKALAGQVGDGRLTRLQAADRLDRKRLELAGHNAIDDAVFKVYREQTVRLQRGQIAQADLRARLIRELDRARRNWNAISPLQRPNAAFTRFLIRIYDQAPL